MTKHKTIQYFVITYNIEPYKNREIPASNRVFANARETLKGQNYNKGENAVLTYKSSVIF